MRVSPQGRAFFPTSELTKVVQTRHVLYILTSECAFRHSGVQFFRHLNFKKVVRDRQFFSIFTSNVLFATAACNFWCLLSAPTSAPAALTGLLFDWPDTRIIEKTQHFATSLHFAQMYLLSSDFRASASSSFRLDWLSHLLFNCPYCRKFLFKLPSNIQSIYIYYVSIYMYICMIIWIFWFWCWLSTPFDLEPKKEATPKSAHQLWIDTFRYHW